MTRATRPSRDHDADDPDRLVTRQRLLEAAGEVFADEGFQAATVRDICTRAGANIAAVHYHFGDKEKLYAAAVRYAHACAVRHASDADVPADAPPEQRLGAFVRGFLMGVLSEGRPTWHGKLMAREMAQPTPAVLKEIAENGVKPRVAALTAILKTILPPGTSQRTLHRCARSVVGQILFYYFARPMLERVFPDERLDGSAIEELADHITTFSMHALVGMSRVPGSGFGVPGGKKSRSAGATASSHPDPGPRNPEPAPPVRRNRKSRGLA